MRVTDLKQIFWWLCGGLLICAGVIVGLMVWKPQPRHRTQYSEFTASCMQRALTTETQKQGKQQNFKRFEATYALKIDGIPPPPPAVVQKTAPKPPPQAKQKYPLSDFIVLAAVWTDVVFYRLKNGPGKLFEVRVGESLPRDRVPQIDPPITLKRIDSRDFPIQVVFLVWGKEEVLLVPKEGVILEPTEGEPITLSEPYRGPNGLVNPSSRKVPKAFSRDKNNALIVGGEVQEILRNNSDALMRGIAWSSHEKGVMISKIAEGSLAKQLIQKAGGTLLQQGDVVVSVNGVKVQSKAQIVNHFRKQPVKPGTMIKVEVLRFGKIVNQTVRMPATAPR